MLITERTQENKEVVSSHFQARITNAAVRSPVLQSLLNGPLCKIFYCFIWNSHQQFRSCYGGSVVKKKKKTIPGSGISSGEGNGKPLQYFAWELPWTEEPGGLYTTGHNLATKPRAAILCIPLKNSSCYLKYSGNSCFVLFCFLKFFL